MSNRNLVIVESPGKVKTLSKYLGDSYVVRGSVGHVRDLPTSDIGIDTDTFEGQYVFTHRGKKIVSDLRKLAKESDTVWLATDADREGEAIAWHLKESLGLKSYKRVVFREITKSAVQKAFTEPRSIDMKMVNSQQGRRLLDRVIGWVVSPALSNATNEKLSAGRVQSVALLIIHNLEERIKSFVKTKHFGVKAYFDGYYAEWDTEPFVTKETPYFMDKDRALLLANNRHFKVIDFERKKNNRNAPPPLNTSTLQQAASVALKFSVDHTMQTAQKLYEIGAITYHRTDSLNLSDVAIDQVRAFLTATGHGDDLPDTPNKWSAAESAQEAHEAIRPSDFSVVTPDGADGDALALYQLIRNRALACQMKAAIFDNATATLQTAGDIPGFESRPIFIAKSRSLFYPGWLKLAAENENEDDTDTVDNVKLPELALGEALEASNGEVVEKSTQPPKRLTEAALVKALEREGIGRPSTYASIIKNIIGRDYIKIEKRLIYEQPKGALVINNLAGKFAFLDIHYTKAMEESLDHVAGGTLDFRELVKGAYTTVCSEINNLKAITPASKPEHLCGECGRPLRLIKGEFWACTGYNIDACKKTYKNKSGKPDMSVKAPLEHSDFDCGACGKKLIRRVSPAKKATKSTKAKPETIWYGCSGFPACKQTYFDLNGTPKYPVQEGA